MKAENTEFFEIKENTPFEISVHSLQYRIFDYSLYDRETENLIVMGDIEKYAEKTASKSNLKAEGIIKYENNSLIIEYSEVAENNKILNRIIVSAENHDGQTEIQNADVTIVKKGYVNCLMPITVGKNGDGAYSVAGMDFEVRTRGISTNVKYDSGKLTLMMKYYSEISGMDMQIIKLRADIKLKKD